MEFSEKLEKHLAEIKEELSKIREPKKAAKTDYLNKLVKLLTDGQLEFYNKMYPSGTPKYIDVAISQVETTLKNLNRDTTKLRIDFKETLKVQEEVQLELREAKMLILELESNLRAANKQIERISTFQTLDRAYTQERLDWLSALENAGVDNWEGYDFARDLYNGKE